MNRSTFQTLLVLGVAISLSGSVRAADVPAAGSAAGRPNVLLVLTDDQGYGDLRSHGNDQIDTPALDTLAAAGARFERFFVSPLCAPTRAALLTGRYFQRTGVTGVCGGAEVMRLDEVTIAQLLKTAGYATGCFGKWHNGENYPYHPNGRGFDTFYGFCGGHWDNYFDTTLERNGVPEKMTGYITDVLTNEAIQFIEANRHRPFFCYLPYNAPHEPDQAPPRYFDKAAKRGLDKHTAAVYAMVENVDDNLGRILQKLDALNIAENTLVIFLTDNGPNGRRFNDGMSGAKGSNREGGCRVPCFMRWPARIRPGTVIKPIAAHIDLLPTLAEICGVKEPKTLPLDGLSLVPLLEGKAGAWPDRMLFETGAVRTQRWRFQAGGKGQGGLFDMTADPGQKVDVSASHPEVVERLGAAYETWNRGVEQGGARGASKTIPVGHATCPAVTLNAHRARCSGVKTTVRWTSAWFAGWRDPKGSVEWDLDVVAGGRFEVALLCTVPPSAVGTTLRVEAGEGRAEGTLDRAHNPDPMAKRDYLNARPEKDWMAVVLGTIEMKKGPATLRVRTVSISGTDGFDAKGVRLRRLGEDRKP
jgi:arylsulfatase A-like enzyme